MGCSLSAVNSNVIVHVTTETIEWPRTVNDVFFRGKSGVPEITPVWGSKDKYRGREGKMSKKW